MGNSRSKQNSPVSSDEDNKVVNSESSEQKQGLSHGTDAQHEEEGSDISSENDSKSDQFVSTKSSQEEGDDHKIVEQKVNININESLEVKRAVDSLNVLWQERLKAKDQQLAQITSDRNELLTENRALQYECQKARQLEDESLEVKKAVDSMNALWQERLKAKDQQLAQITSERNDLLSENRALQYESQKARQLEDLLDLTLKDAESSRMYLEDKFSAELTSSIRSHQLETKQCLQRICPTVSIDSSLCFNDWLQQFEIQAEDFRKSKVLIIGKGEQEYKTFEDKQTQYEDFQTGAKNICCINRLKNSENFQPIKKSKSLGQLNETSEGEKSLKRKIEVLEKEEQDLKLNMLSSYNPDQEPCGLCKELARQSLLHPVQLILNYTEYNKDKMSTFIVDTNIVMDHMATVAQLLSTIINGNMPVVMVPYIVIKEIDHISKEKSDKNKVKAFLARQAMKKLEKLLRTNPRIVEQTLEEMRACSIGKSKRKVNDDIILECCIHVRKSGYNVILWSEDRNIRIKTIGHRILALCTKDICEIISTQSLNPLEVIMGQNEKITSIIEIMKELPTKLIEDITTDPKNAIGILTGMQEIIIQPSVEKTTVDEPTPGPSSEIDVDVSVLFKLPEEIGENSSWRVMKDGNFCIDDGDDDIY